MTFEELVQAIGLGFHPDTPGDKYTSLPEGITPEDVDRIVNEAWAESDMHLAPDPYRRTLAVLGEGND